MYTIGLFFSVVGVCLIAYGIREGILKGNKEESKIKKGFLNIRYRLGIFLAEPQIKPAL